MIDINWVDIIDKGIKLLPQIVLYIVPGYISLTIYYASRDRSIRENKLLLVKCIFLSYLYVVCVEQFPYLMRQDKIVCKIFSISLLAVVSGLLGNYLLHIKLIRKLMSFLHHTTLCSNIVDEILDIGKGIYVRAYMRDELIVYEGYLIRDRLTEQGKHYLILDCYRKDTIEKTFTGYKKHSVHEYDEMHDRCVVIDYDEIKYIELKYDKLSIEDNREIKLIDKFKSKMCSKDNKIKHAELK